MDYQIEIKQIVDYPRCRIYRSFFRDLMEDRNIRTNGSSYLFYYMVLCSFANFRSLIVTDPKSELYGDFALYLEQHGYTVRVFNLIHPENSDSWNCLSEIDGQDTMAQLFCDVIIKNTSSKNETRFWADAELNILKAAVLYVYYGFPPEGRNIGQVYKLLTLNTEEELCSLFQMLPNTHPAKYPYSIFRRAQESVRNDVVSGLGIRLQVFQNELIRKITGHNEIDLTLPGKKKCAYFCITSDQDSTFDFLSSLFMSFVFIKLVRYADEQDGCKLPVPVHILADEIANGVLSQISQKRSARSVPGNYPSAVSCRISPRCRTDIRITSGRKLLAIVIHSYSLAVPISSLPNLSPTDPEMSV